MLAEELTPPWRKPNHRFPGLKSITLEVKCLCSTVEDTSGGFKRELRAIARIVLAEFELEKQRDPY